MGIGPRRIDLSRLTAYDLLSFSLSLAVFDGAKTSSFCLLFKRYRPCCHVTEASSSVHSSSCLLSPETQQDVCVFLFLKLAPEFGHCQCTTDGAPMFSDMCFDSGASVHDRSRRLFPRHSLARVCPTDQLSSYNTMYCRRLALSVSRPFSFCFVLRRRSARRGGGDNENDDSSSSPSGHI